MKKSPRLPLARTINSYYVTDIMMIHSGSYADSISFNELYIYYNFTTSNKYQLIVKNAIIFSYFKYLDIHFRDNS